MAIEGRQLETNETALEDLRTHQYKAFAINDGKRAENAEEASGVIAGKPNTNDHASIIFAGEVKVYAGGAVAKGDKLTVGAGGLFTTAGSDDTVIGEAKGTATGSGSLVNALVAFQQTTGKAQNFVTPLSSVGATTLAGVAIALDDQEPANNAEEFAGVSQSAVDSGDAGNLVVCGITPALMADTTSVGDGLTIATSGYFSIGDSGDNIVGRCITNTASGIAGLAYISGKPGYLFT